MFPQQSEEHIKNLLLLTAGDVNRAVEFLLTTNTPASSQNNVNKAASSQSCFSIPRPDKLTKCQFCSISVSPPEALAEHLSFSHSNEKEPCGNCPFCDCIPAYFLNFKPSTVHASSNILNHLTIRHPYSLHCLKFQNGNKWLPWQTSPTIPAVVDGTLKIMTYNVWFGAIRLKERCTSIVGIIKKSGAQVVAMQEVFI